MIIQINNPGMHEQIKSGKNRLKSSFTIIKRVIKFYLIIKTRISRLLLINNFKITILIHISLISTMNHYYH